MDFYFTPTTELEAVNTMLASIGQSPVNTLNVTGIRDVAIAQSFLHNTSREVQTRGWHFNTDTNFPLTLNAQGECVIPSNALRADPTDRLKNYVVRSGKFWDKDNHTFVLQEAPKVDLVLFLPFDDLPQAARTYIYTRAARLFQSSVVGSQILHQYTEQAELEAWALLRRAENKTKDTNLLTGASSTNRIIHRRW